MTTVLQAIVKIPSLVPLVSGDAWVNEITTWGKNIALFRQYVDGSHRLEMTTKMSQMLRITKEEDERFSLNYADIVVNKMADRLHIERIEADGDNDEGNEWVQSILDASAFDELQIDVTSDTIADGDTFVIIDPPKDGELSNFIHEPAWDNISGMIPVYNSSKRKMVAVIKVWGDLALDADRINIYFDDRIEKYYESGGDLIPYDDGTYKDGVVPWVDKTKKPLGIPIGHFRNRKKTRRIFGQSEVQKILPPQDVLNRTFVSMTMTSELTAFQRLVFIGMEASADMSPGAVWESVIKKDGVPQAGIPNDLQVDVKVIPAGEIGPFVEQAQFTIEQISVISDTPIPSVMGGDVQSGEALKQREIGLIAKARTAQIVSGNVWERLVILAHSVEEAFGPTPPQIETTNTIWSEINVRDTAQIVDNVVKIGDWLDSETRLKELEPAMDYGIADIPNIIEAKRDESSAVLGQLALPGFDRLQ